MMALCMLLAAVAALILPSAYGAGDSVVVRFDAKPKPDVKTLFAASADISNAAGKWQFGVKNLRAHGNAPRRFSFATGNGRQNGFSGLISSVALEVNGIPWEKLLVRERGVRQWNPPGDRRGVEMFFNFVRNKMGEPRDYSGSSLTMRINTNLAMFGMLRFGGRGD
ncbi:MAG: hypothetical protein IJI35_09415 [Kiritimatiellae bacterium]|nr:hypothetical protein [Kiritimatiellia bacterium]